MPRGILTVKNECCFAGKSVPALLISPSFRTTPRLKPHHDFDAKDVDLLPFIVVIILILNLFLSS